MIGWQNKIRWLVPMLLAGWLTLGPVSPTSAQDSGRRGPNRDFTLTILHNNDAESRVLPQGEDGEIAGVARFGSVLKRARQQAIRGNGKDRNDKRGVIFVSSGDNFLAGPTFSASRADGIYYDALALDLLGYDAIALGNHDFDFGPDVLQDFIEGGFRTPGRPPFISANLDFSLEPGLQGLVDDGVIARSTIVNERGERIGIVGATTPNLSFISSPRNVIVLQNVAEEVQAEVDLLAGAGVNKIVFISHLQGISDDLAVIGQLTGIDVAVAGGGDELLANPGDPLLPGDGPADIFGSYPLIAFDAKGNQVPVVTTSGQYGYLGRLEVKFDSEGLVTEASGGPLRVVDPAVGPDGVRPDSRLRRFVEEPVAAYVAGLAENVIGLSEVNLNGIRNDIRSRETNEGNLIADSQLWQANQLAADFGVAQADVALQNGGGIRNDTLIPAGEITELDTFEMLPFPNFLTIVENVDRVVFRDLLENAVSRVDAFGNPSGSGTGRFAQVAGLTMIYDSSLPAGARISDVLLDDGTPLVIGGVVQPGPGINVAIVDFLARGGDEYDFGGASFTVLAVSYQQALFNYITAPVAEGGLGSLIPALQYPAGGEGRIINLALP
jgi:5'-nucleotidase